MWTYIADVDGRRFFQHDNKPQIPLVSWERGDGLTIHRDVAFASNFVATDDMLFCTIQTHDAPDYPTRLVSLSADGDAFIYNELAAPSPRVPFNDTIVVQEGTDLYYVEDEEIVLFLSDALFDYVRVDGDVLHLMEERSGADTIAYTINTEWELV